MDILAAPKFEMFILSTFHLMMVIAKLVCVKGGITVAEDVSGMPALCRPLKYVRWNILFTKFPVDSGKEVFSAFCTFGVIDQKMKLSFYNIIF